jgi:hypothetical protein
MCPNESFRRLTRAARASPQYCANPQALKKHLRSHGEDGSTALAALDAADLAALGDEAAAADGRSKWYYCPVEGCHHNPGGSAAAHPFKTLRNLRDHYQTAHNAASADCLCNKCGKPFKVKSRMQSHQKHCGDVYRCSCACSFRERRSLLHHLGLFPSHNEVGRVNPAGELVGAAADGAEGGEEDGGAGGEEEAHHGGLQLEQ